MPPRGTRTAQSTTRTTRTAKKSSKEKAEKNIDDLVPSDVEPVNPGDNMDVVSTKDNNEPEAAPASSATKAATRKRERKANDNQEKNDPPTKRSKTAKDQAAEMPTERKGRGRPRKDVPAPPKIAAPSRDPLPGRSKRNNHPGVVDAKATRRPSHEVQAERQALILALEEKKRDFEEAKRQYAQMTVDEEELDNEVSGKNPQRLSAANHFCREVAEVNSSEEFDFGDIEGLPSSELESDSVPVKKKKVTPKLLIVLMILTMVHF
jgi:hypothetical protein